ncbi:hypothetical protein [Micromonospora fulviviridis]|uniref:Peptidase inhibitor family I36 n=1 Tax=Micromonospora fulviviridis TaxID=47860 RepID=A0ABV2VNL5_9ACTN
MVNSRARRILLAAVLAWLLAILCTPTAALAENTAHQRQLADYLAAHPGGTVVNDNEISYQGGRFVVTLRRAEVGTTATADCPWGWYCFYEWPNFGYPRGRLSSCGWQNLATWSWQYRVESAHYNLGSGYVSFYYYFDQRLFDVGAGNRVRSDASPYRNWANYVYRYCP